MEFLLFSCKRLYALAFGIRKRSYKTPVLCSVSIEDTRLNACRNTISIIFSLQDEKNQVLTTFGWLEVVSVQYFQLFKRISLYVKGQVIQLAGYFYRDLN